GHQVKLHIDDEGRRGNLHNLVNKTSNWKDELKWVGKKGLIVFDDVGYGAIQDELRAEGYNVFGSCAMGDRLEMDRVFGQEVFAEHGMSIVPIKNFATADAAIRFVKKNPGAWVIKQNSTSDKGLNYVGLFNDGRDVLDVLYNYKNNK